KSEAHAGCRTTRPPALPGAAFRVSWRRMAARSDPDPSFARCLGLARAGHRSALGDLLEAARPQLIEAARASIGSRLRAKVRTSDLVQSALLEGLRSLDEFRGTSRSEFAGWLHRILENNVRDR